MLKEYENHQPVRCIQKRNGYYCANQTPLFMEFIGIGVKQSEKYHSESVRDKAAGHDLLVSKTISIGRFREGLEDFSSFFDLSLFQFSAFSEETRKASSRQISAELAEFHSESKQNSFLNFLTEGKDALPETFYLIFASEWFPGEPVRLEKIRLSELKSYFTRNNSWYLWIYNYSAKSYYPKLEIPLVLEVINDGLPV